MAAKTKAELLEEIEQKNEEIKVLEKEVKNLEKYKQYEAENGWGTVESTMRFFEKIISAWNDFVKYDGKDLVDVTTFWIE